VLVVVAAGLLANALHTAHEAGWWNSMLGQAADLSSIVKPGSVRYAIFNGMFGIQPRPAWGEVLVWFLYAVPMTIVVLRPARPKRLAARTTAVAATVALVLGLLAVGAGAATEAAAKEVKIELTDKGCPKSLTVPAGRTTFSIENVDSSEVTEFEVLDGKKVVGEKENIVAGLSGSFTIDLKAGRYTLYCPNGDRERGVLVVTGAATAKETAATRATAVKVTLGEFVVKAKPGSAAAGRIAFVVTNQGSMTHEFVVARSADGTLPLDASGAVDETQIPATDKLGELEDLERGDKARLDTTLTPGTYVLFCNITEKSGGVTDHHYADGMHTTFTVK